MIKRKQNESLYDVELDDIGITGIKFISIVDKPAIGVQGMIFSDENVELADRPPFHDSCKCQVINGDLILDPEACDYCEEKLSEWKNKSSRPGGSSFLEMNFTAIEEKQIIVGPILIPDIEIPRKDPDTGERYFLRFKSEIIKELVSRFNRSNNNKAIDFDHSHNLVNAYLMENWIIEDKVYDKSRMYNFDLPVGTWMGIIKVEDKDFWKEGVKQLGMNSFSVEGILGRKLVALSREIDINELIDGISADDLIKIFKEI